MSAPSEITDDLRIVQIDTLAPPSEVMARHPATPNVAAVVGDSRRAVQQILRGEDDRLLVVIGPCSIHDPQAAMDYAQRLAAERARHAGELEIVMRVYFEKPRTTVGWKGLINDPHLDGTFRIDEGLNLARRILLDVNALGLPAAVEFLDVITPQYLADLVAWGAIGARTTESQIHREMASGLSCPVGFKNGTDGNLRIAVDAVKAASQPHHFLAVGKDGRAGLAATRGNLDAHVVLRGGKAPNYDAASIAMAAAELASAGLPARLVVDASHANSGKKPENQPAVVRDLAGQIAGGEGRICGVMVESHLVAGRQDLIPGQPLTYGQSITDGCIDWETSVEALDVLARAVRARRGLAYAGVRGTEAVAG
ncbi:MAG: 3-deoxy-7-phosphoheptulonate synthase [Phenylobacterium sp.]|uniref:3-deoxy-7-phosphoheptulonate synthase n=1 Tax=Phenylobacterium sp. TaxID=1871053 RepID=UPI00391A54DA